MILFHGSNADNLDSLLSLGIKGNKALGYEVRGSSFASPKPDVAFAYACMLGGEQSFSGYLPENKRVLLVLDVPNSWYDDNLVMTNGGSCPEVSFKADIPAEFIVDYIIGDRKAVYSYL